MNDLSASIQFTKGQPIWIDFTNWKGKRARRLVYPMDLAFSKSQEHGPELQLYLNVLMPDRGMARRSIHVPSIHGIYSEPSNASE